MALSAGLELVKNAAAENELRRALALAVRELAKRGLNTGTSGNASCLLNDGRILITRTGAACESVTEESLVLMDAEGHVHGRGIPSCEWQMHSAIYSAKAEARSVIHTHSDACVVLSCLRRSIPAFHYRVANFGGNDIQCASYAMFGTPELARSAISALESRQACLLANHGMVCWGKSLSAALNTAIELEALARQYLMALQVGEPVILNETDIASVREGFERYPATIPG
jgi:L-fuculose-phosphate aldolase